ncbi:MAG: hypothetical protein J07HR59_01371 [Halorubrum sp. J07HR59]|nr:MAG: hypothetical protein J07HR59_01371 [Halorubrum sp. J07HR59]
MPTTCALCRRRIPDGRIPDPQVVQRHHLRPERRDESPTVQLCRPCHKQIHALFTNAELRESYDDIDRLQSADRLAGYLSWIRGTDKLDVDVRTIDILPRLQSWDSSVGNPASGLPRL